MPGSTADRITAARAAYESGSVQASRAAHARNLGLDEAGRLASASVGADEQCYNAVCESGHDLVENTASKCALYGAVDGVSTACIVFAACAGAGLPLELSFRMTQGVCTALGLAHGLRDAVRCESEKQLYDRERRREAWELSNYREGEEAEMVELYVSKGVSRADATTAISALARHDAFFVDLMMTQELGLQMPDSSPWVAAACSAGGFLGSSLLPLGLVRLFLSLSPTPPPVGRATSSGGSPLSGLQSGGLDGTASALLQWPTLPALPASSFRAPQSWLHVVQWVGRCAGVLLTGHGLGLALIAITLSFSLLWALATRRPLLWLGKAGLLSPVTARRWTTSSSSSGSGAGSDGSTARGGWVLVFNPRPWVVPALAAALLLASTAAYYMGARA